MEQKTKFDNGTWKHEIRKISDLHPNPNNPRVITKETLKGLKKSMQENGYTHRIIVDKDNMILSGHARWLVFKEKDPTAEIEVLAAQRELTEQEIKHAIIGHNVDGGEWNIEELQMNFADIASEYDIIPDKSDDYDTKEVEEVDVPEEAPTRVQPGDIWQLGEHTLICGDSTNATHVQNLMAGRKADLLLTDPPYNVGLGMDETPEEAKKRNRRTDGLIIKNDKMEDIKFQEFLTTAFVVAESNMKPGAVFYIWHADSEGYNFRAACKTAGFQLRECLIWVKNSLVMGRQDYQWRHEPCLYGWKDGASHKWNGGRKQSTTIEAIDLMNEEELRKAYKELTEQIENSVIYEDKPKVNKQHPTMKPIKLLARLIRNSSNVGDLVLDLFGGSGSTLMACEQVGRKCCINELDPHYCDVIIERWEQFTGKQATKLN